MPVIYSLAQNIACMLNVVFQRSVQRVLQKQTAIVSCSFFSGSYTFEEGGTLPLLKAVNFYPTGQLITAF